MSARFIECIQLFFALCERRCTKHNNVSLNKYLNNDLFLEFGLFKPTTRKTQRNERARERAKKQEQRHQQIVAYTTPNMFHINIFVSLVNHLQWISANSQNFLWMILSTRFDVRLQGSSLSLRTYTNIPIVFIKTARSLSFSLSHSLSIHRFVACTFPFHCCVKCFTRTHNYNQAKVTQPNDNGTLRSWNRA